MSGSSPSVRVLPHRPRNLHPQNSLRCFLRRKLLARCNLPMYNRQMLHDQRMEHTAFQLAEATAEQLGGLDILGCRVLSDADMARAVELGFPVDAIDELRRTGVTDREIGNLIIKPRTLSHRRAKRSRLTVEESDRAARVARILALARKTFANRDKADRWLHKELSALDGRRPMDLIRTHAGARIVEDLLTGIAWGAAA